MTKKKKKNKTLESLLQGNLYEMYKYYRELASSYQANSVSKDDIKLKIKELEETIDGIIQKEKDVEDYQCEEYYKIQVLKELLEETNERNNF